MMICKLCDLEFYPNNTGEPYLEFKDKVICFDCYMNIAPEIYKMAGYGDGGMIHLIFNSLVSSSYNRESRQTVHQYRKVLKKLKHKYKFKCVACGSKDNLTIDHIEPVSKGGSDDISNLQLMCRPCNSSKGNR